MSDVLLARYDRWDAQRSDMAERDCEPDGPTASEWQWSDDEAVILLHEFASRARGGTECKPET